MISSLIFTLADAAAPQAGQSSGPASILGNPLIAFGAVIVMFYYMAIRPQNQRNKALKELVSNLKTGDKVITSSGIHGIISNVKEGTTLSLKIADNVKIEIDKSAIATVEKAEKNSES